MGTRKRGGGTDLNPVVARDWNLWSLLGSPYELRCVDSRHPDSRPIPLGLQLSLVNLVRQYGRDWCESKSAT